MKVLLITLATVCMISAVSVFFIILAGRLPHINIAWDDIKVILQVVGAFTALFGLGFLSFLCLKRALDD